MPFFFYLGAHLTSLYLSPDKRKSFKSIIRGGNWKILKKLMKFEEI